MSSVLALWACAFLASGPAATPGPAPSAAEICPSLIGEQIPAASVVDLEGNVVELRALVATTPTVLVFYRGGWCPYCNKQLAQLKEVEPILKELGIALVAMSPDSLEDLKKTVQKHELTYKLVSDTNLQVAKLFGLAYATKSEDFGDKPGGKPWKAELPVPAVYLVAPNGRVLYQYVNVNYKVRLSGEMLLTAAKAYGLAR